MNREPTNPPRDYRLRLYEAYSANFGEGKRFDPGVQFRQYETCYGSMLPGVNSAVGDLGCGKGEWLAWLQTKGFGNLWGADWSAEDAAIARSYSPGISIEEGDILRKLRENRGRFDLLHAKDVIEHLRPDELFEFLDACRFALKPGGALWLLTDNAQSPFANVTRYGDFTHEIGLTPTSMRQVLTAAGFEVVSIRGVHICPATAGGFVRKWIWRICGGIARVLLRSRHGGAAPAGIDAFTAAPDLFAIARKPTAS
jgi:2-polyprenyl-3-methyl-5-hydroxy-6-metoxy-1,4-benzoquinol methylase